MYLTPDGLRWTLRWATDVIESYDGSEQRIRLATLPRASYSGGLFFDDADLAGGRALLASDPAEPFDLPVPFETVASVNAITGTTITIVPTYVDWNVVGREVYVRRPDGTAYTTTINTVGGAGATLTVDDSPPAGTWPAGSTTVTPIEAIQLEDGQAFSRWPKNAGRWQFAGRQATARAVTGTGGTLTTYASLDVLTYKPTAEGLAQEQVLGGVLFQDAGGAMTSSGVFTAGKPRRTSSWLIVGELQRQWWKAFLTARRGRCVSFLCPTWRPDLDPLTMTPGAVTFTIDATYTDYLTRWWPSLAHRRVQIEFSDGSVIYRTVSSAADLGAGVTELTLSVALPGSFPGAVSCVSLLELARLDVDEVSIEWQQANIGRIELPIVVVQA